MSTARTNSTPSTPSSSSFQPTATTCDIPGTSVPIDIALFQSLEARAAELAFHLTETVQQLEYHMTKMSHGTVEAGQVYKSAVQELSADLATSTQSTAQLIAQCDELDKDLAQIQLLSKQIKQVDKGLGRLLQSL